MRSARRPPPQRSGKDSAATARADARRALRYADFAFPKGVIPTPRFLRLPEGRRPGAKMLQRVSSLPAFNDGALVKAQAYVDGQWCDGAHGRFDVINPADGGKLIEVSNCGAADAQRAIDAAARALPAWRARTAKERAVLLRKWYELMMAAQEDLAVGAAEGLAPRRWPAGIPEAGGRPDGQGAGEGVRVAAVNLEFADCWPAPGPGSPGFSCRRGEASRTSSISPSGPRLRPPG